MHDSFFDTNILAYLVGADSDKATRTAALVAGGGVISVQVLNELANVGRRTMKLEWAELRTMLAIFGDLFHVRALTLEVHRSALALAERHKLSVFDAMIVAAALDAGCKTLWSEDMHHGLVIEHQLRITNPFVSAA